MSWKHRLECSIGALLEHGAPPRSPPARGLHVLAQRAWDAGVLRPLVLRSGTRVVGVGGSTLGGSGKTPLAIAVCLELARRGRSVAFVGHGHRASPGSSTRRAFQVRATDRVDRVGDEALVASDALAGKASVVVGATRQAAIDLAAELAPFPPSLGSPLPPILVVDGMLQARPERVARSILALDGPAPWGAGWVPPFGNLRASPRALLDAADVVAWGVDELDQAAQTAAPEFSERYGVAVACVPWRVSHVLAPDGRRLALTELRHLRLGLLIGIARPQRLPRMLERRGVDVTSVLTWGDHAPADADVIRRAETLGRAHRIEAWLSTAKCRKRLPPEIGGAPILALQQELLLGHAAANLLLAGLTGCGG